MAFNDVIGIGILFLSSFGRLALAALGLVIIYGMMGVINFAHGEFIMVGAFTTALSWHAGIPLPVAIIFGGLATGVVGLVVERAVVRHFYHRQIEAMVATWGVSVILTQGFFIVFGQTISGIGIPFGVVSIGGYTTAVYNFVLGLGGIILLLLTYLVFLHTRYGLHARATMQDDVTARNLGIDTDKMFRNTFVLGSGLAGIAGGLFAPTIVLVPFLGRQYIIDAFVVVIVGGSNVLIGTPASAALLGFIDGMTTHIGGSLLGRVAMLIMAIIILRFLPTGLSGFAGSGRS